MSTYADRLAALRDQLARDRLDGFVVPLTDEHMSEYVGSYAQRLAWLTGFQGSAGTAVVMPAEAAIFTDGRYTIQVREQVDGSHWDYVPVPEQSVAGLARRARQGGSARIGYDAWLHTRAWVAEAGAALADIGAELVAVDTNPVDAVWPDRPLPSKARLVAHDDALAGRNSASKRAEIADWLAAQRADAVVLTALDSIAWALNVRGADVDHTPVALAYAIVDADGATDLFIDGDKIDETVVQHLGNSVRVRNRLDFAPALADYAGKRVAADPGTRGRRNLRRARGGRREGAGQARPRRAGQGDQESRRSCRTCRGERARRRCADALSALGRDALRRWQPDRIVCRRQASRIP